MTAPPSPAHGVLRLLNTADGRVLCLAGHVDGGLVDAFLRHYGREPARIDGIDGGSVTTLSAQAAELVRDHDTLQLRVHAALGSSPTRDFHEVWLIDPDDVTKMVALGNLADASDAVLPVPAGTDLNRYRLVDVSDEPHDGNATHSGRSLLRGTLTN